MVLVNPGRFLYYSGMAPGLISRLYSLEESRIDVRYLVEKGGGRFIEDRVEEIRPREGEVLLEGGGALRYDAMSVCLGSGVPEEILRASGERLVPVKPVGNMEGLHRTLLDMGKSGRSIRVLIVGGGPAGCEISCNVSRLLEGLDVPGRVTIAEADDALLGSSPRRAREEIERFLEARGVEVLTGTAVEKVEERAAHTRDGRKLDFDLAVLAVGIRPPGAFRRSGLAVGEDDGLWVNHYLQSVSDPRIFGGGDSVSFRGDALPRLGVFAIRQGPILFHNLQAFLRGEPLKEFRPQAHYLYIITLGNLEGLAIWGPLAWRGAGAWKLKRRIDKKFVEGFQYPEDKPGEVRAYLDRLAREDAAGRGSRGEVSVKG